MKKRAFTLVEIIVCVVIAGILATVGLPVYQNIIESSKEKVCDTNLMTLNKAVEIYTVEHDTVPGSLSQLTDKYLDKAFASVMSGKDGWKRRLAYFIVEGPQWGRAYAAATPKPYGLPHLRCPANPDTSPSAVSYGLNAGLAGISAFEYKNLGNDTVVVADSSGEVFSYDVCPGPKSKSSPWYEVPFALAIQTRAHKTYKLLSQPDYFLKSVDKNGRIGRVTSSNYNTTKQYSFFHFW
jgi:prepilin-type N-terminal cleavage/methylation domain-containing protein